MARAPYIDRRSFMAEAERIAGADDWGDDGFEEAFNRFVDALNTEAELTPEGVERTRSHILKLLVGRLRLFADRKTYPDIAKEEVRTPLVVTGLGRSGTSYLNALIAADERNHAPLHWQVWSPSPPPRLPGADIRPSIEAGERYITVEGWQDPEVRKTHDYTAFNACEDTLMEEYSFYVGSFGFFWNVPSFSAWLSGTDLSPGYRVQRKLMQALQYGDKRDQWVVKGPLHVGQLSYLFGEFPDARVIVAHRDPVKSLASITSMLIAHRLQFGNPAPEVGREDLLNVMEGNVRRVEDMLRHREDPAVDRQFVDVGYLDLERDPLGQVAKVYAHHGLDFTPDARAAMERYVAENRKGKHGAHKYDIREMGLSVEEVRERFRFYTDLYDIPYEA